MSKKMLIVILSSIVVAIGIIIFCLIHFKEEQAMVEIGLYDQVPDNEFDYKMIHKVNENYDTNYLISPLSMAYAISMLREGALDSTRKEIDDLLGNYRILYVNNVKNRIGVANAIFINSKFKKEVNKDYIKSLKRDYNAELVFDKFNGPKKVNDWVEDKTFKMIPNALPVLTPNNVMVLVNTIAIDLEWQKEFDKEATQSQEFELKDGSKINVAMMKQSNSVKYIKSDKAQGIVKDYKTYNDSSRFEYIAILPDGDLNEYINNFDSEEYNKLLSSRREADGESLRVNYSLPKYTYDFSYDRFKEDLMSLGMQEAFSTSANFGRISDSIGIYVNDAIHKTHVEVSEKGTKAAAVTAISFKSTAIDPSYIETINIDFDRPFIYIIRDRKYDNIWFFGVVYEPMKWENNK